MIVSLFKTRQPGYYVFLSLLSIVVYISVVRSAMLVTSENGMLLYRLITAYADTYGNLYFIAGLILFVLQGIQIHLLVNQFEVLYKSSYLPWLMYMVLMGSVPGLLMFSPALLSNTLLLLMLDRIFRIYKSEYAQGYHFEAAAMLSLAVCIYLPALSFILLLIASILILHPFDWRNWVSAILGFMTPLYMLAFILFLTDRTALMIPENFLSGYQITFKIKSALPPSYTVTAVIVFIISVISILTLRENFYKNTSRTRSYQQVVIIYFFITLLIPFFTPGIPLFKFALPAIPLSILIGYYLLAVRKNWVADTALILLVALALFNHLKLTFSL